MHREAHHVVEAPFDPRNKRSSRGLQGEAGPECQTRPLPGSDPKRFVCVRVCIGMCAAFQDVPGCRTRRPCPWVRQTECTLRSSRARAERRSRAFPPKSNELLQAPRHLATSQPLDGQQNGVRARNAARGKCGSKPSPNTSATPLCTVCVAPLSVVSLPGQQRRGFQCACAPTTTHVHWRITREATKPRSAVRVFGHGHVHFRGVSMVTGLLEDLALVRHHRVAPDDQIHPLPRALRPAEASVHPCGQRERTPAAGPSCTLAWGRPSSSQTRQGP
jgi:hypothetical protein